MVKKKKRIHVRKHPRRTRKGKTIVQRHTRNITQKLKKPIRPQEKPKLNYERALKTLDKAIKLAGESIKDAVREGDADEVLRLTKFRLEIIDERNELKRAMKLQKELEEAKYFKKYIVDIYL